MENDIVELRLDSDEKVRRYGRVRRGQWSLIKSLVVVSPSSRRNCAPNVSSSWKDKVSRMCKIDKVAICLVLIMESIHNEVIGYNLYSWYLTIETSSLFRLSKSSFLIQWVAW